MNVDVRPPDGSPRFTLVAALNVGGFVLRTTGVAVVIDGRSVLAEGQIRGRTSVRNIIMHVDAAYVLTPDGVDEFPPGTYLVRSDRFVRIGEFEIRQADINLDAVPPGGVRPGETIAQAIIRTR
jgi:hypothetical protein